MKITSIEVSNFQMLTDINIDMTNTPICLIAGANEQGKSSLHEAIRFALTGESTRVRLKKDLAAIVRTGAKRGHVDVCLTDGDRVTLNLPSGSVDKTGMIVSEIQEKVLPLVLDAGRFAALPDNERRSLLFELSDLQLNSRLVGELLIKRGCNSAKVDAILPALRAGFPSAEAEAREKIRESKAAWKATAGGETWGKDKGSKWQPAALPPDADKAEDLATTAQRTATKLEAKLAEAQQRLGAAKFEAQRRQGAAQQRADLEEKVSKIEIIREKVAKIEKELAAQESVIKDLEARTGTGPREGLVHDLARALAAFIDIRCDSSGVAGYHRSGDVAVWDEFELDPADAALLAYGVQYGKLDEAGDPEAATALPAAHRTRTQLASTVERERRELASAEAAAAALTEMTNGEVSGEVDLDNVTREVNGLSNDLNDLRAEVKQHQKVAVWVKQRQESIDKTAALHTSILEWQNIADELAPGGIPSEMLAGAIKPLNDRLRTTATATGWEQVRIDGDMQIRVGDHPYGLKSESARWRADAALAEAISYLSDLRFIALDRCDVMDADNRLAFLRWLHDLATTGDIDTALVFGTFKTLPSAPATFFTAWLEGGAIIESNNSK
ncbi:AAA family ATPase [Pectobacterium versatile]|uniref:AAA family ATPase n=1 Tax=Pectobacterium versatile TaxID=2488639 RepID=UPI001CCD707C|nr:AAA family ATPase [Pectobacterium versatile]